MAVDMVKAYVRFDDLLHEYGYDRALYSVQLDVWNHRTGLPTVSYSLSAQLPDGWENVRGDSFEEAFEAFRAKLVRHETGATAVTDLAEVRVPEGATAQRTQDSTAVPF